MIVIVGAHWSHDSYQARAANSLDTCVFHWIRSLSLGQEELLGPTFHWNEGRETVAMSCVSMSAVITSRHLQGWASNSPNSPGSPLIVVILSDRKQAKPRFSF